MFSNSKNLAHNQNEQDKPEYHFQQDPQLGLYVLADGSQGRNGLRVATEACNLVFEYIQRQRNTIIDRQTDTRILDQFLLKKIVDSAIQYTNSTLYDLSSRNSKYSKGSISLEVVLVCSGFAVIGHIGDTNTHLLRAKHQDLAIQDYTLAEKPKKKNHSLKKQEPRIKLIPKNLGVTPTIKVASISRTISTDDTLVLCTKGFVHSCSAGDPNNLLEKLNKIDQSLNVEEFTEELRKILKAKASKKTAALVVRTQKNEKRVTIQASQIAREVELLRKCELFKKVIESDEDLDTLHYASSRPKISAGSRILTKGIEVSHLSIISSGTAHVYVSDTHIESLVLKSGDVIGELEFIEEAEALADVYAAADTELITFDKKQLLELRRTNPRLALRLIEALFVRASRKLSIVTAERNLLATHRTTRSKSLVTGVKREA